MKGLRIGLAVLLLFSVAAHGAVEVWSESLVEIGAAILLVLWAILVFRNPGAEIAWNPLNWPLLGFWCVGALQYVFHLTAYPYLTLTELLRAGTCWAVFFLVTQAYRSRADLQGFAWFLVLVSFAVSLLGIIQYFTSQDEIYWFRHIASGVKPFGPYVNRNHFAGFVELTLPVGMSLLAFRGFRRDAAPLLTLLTIVPISAVVLSGSRAGIIGVAVEIVILTALRWQRRRAERVRLGSVAVLITAAALLIGWVGAGNAVARFVPGGAAGVSLSRRVSMAKSAAQIFLAHPIAGCGLGTIVAVYPKYETVYDGKLVDHVHNDYAEAVAETGLLGGICGASFLFLLARDGWRKWKAEQGQLSRALHAGAIAALVGLLLHSAVDFNLHIFSNALLFLTQACLVTAPVLPSTAPPLGRSRVAPSAGG